MSVSALSQPISPMQNQFGYSNTNIRQSLEYNHKSISVEAFKQDGKIILSLSDTNLYMESTYTSEGIMKNSLLPSQENSGNLSTGGVVPMLDEFEASEKAMAANIQEQYLELIKQRVEYLLKALSRTIKNNSPSRSSGTSDEFAVYSGRTIVTSNILTLTPESPDFSYWSAEKTSERILRFALSFYDGGDRKEYAEMIRAAVMKGYHEAGKALGGFLPQVSHDTITLVNRALDEFAHGNNVNISM